MTERIQPYEVEHSVAQIKERLEPLKNKYDSLAEADLIVVRTHDDVDPKFIQKIIESVWSEANYIQMDLGMTPDKIGGDTQPEIQERIDEILLKTALNNPAEVLPANCYDRPLVLDIAQKLGSKDPIFFTFNGLYGSIAHRRVISDDYEVPRGSHDLLHPEMPYTSHVHLTDHFDLWDDDNAFSRPYNAYQHLAAVAQSSAMWKVEKTEDGLVLIK